MVNRFLRTFGAMLSLAAVLAMSGGHWLTLQSVAWARMFVEFSRHSPAKIALARTFDGRHPCSMCLLVRKGWQHEQEQERRVPGQRVDPAPELFCELGAVRVPPPPDVPRVCPVYAAGLISDFIDRPPTPPPRADGDGV